MTTSSSPHRIVIAGCGSMARTWAAYALERPHAEIVGLVDLYETSARSFAGHFGLAVPIFADLDEAITATGANLVFDVTIPESHKQIASTAIARGCSIFSEKPMAASYEDAKELAALAEKSGARYAIMQNRRFLPKARALKDFIATEAIGPIGAIHADFFLGPHFGGFRDLMEHPLILDMAIHTFDQARQISGANPVSVYCHEFNPPGSWYQGHAAAICIFEMSDGSVFSYRGSWCAEGFATSWQADWRILGAKGTVRWDGENDPVCEMVDESQRSAFMRPVKRVDVPVAWQGREGHLGCLDDMFDSLEAGRPSETEYFDNILSLSMVFGAIQSSKSGQKVMLA
ncbi:Predicted dehydrogenase [Paenibacillus sp. UNCCL117]|uniref:Gfo/Idh/MocA family protein n=1 Tax=unclassified Paenibacillus TaxID=185978 RepID=UPI00088F01CC|nr:MULTISPECIES: Gfo/Idh/MocA family oxidoreductase [unclassified Paenibacillus]SDD00508.1 Predicted dehydrogenase [Paenibacillus sp. cl123]SFW32856.1 Predicted dehydrogenase [Paenibacillus sp. UNCCL117]